MSVAIEERQLTFRERIAELRAGNYTSIEEVPPSKEVVIRLNATDIVILSFIVGAVISLIITLAYKVFTARKVEPKVAPKESHTDVGYAGMLAEEDFDYPYEDIGDALRQ